MRAKHKPPISSWNFLQGKIVEDYEKFNHSPKDQIICRVQPNSINEI